MARGLDAVFTTLSYNRLVALLPWFSPTSRSKGKKFFRTSDRNAFPHPWRKCDVWEFRWMAFLLQTEETDVFQQERICHRENFKMLNIQSHIIDTIWPQIRYEGSAPRFRTPSLLSMSSSSFDNLIIIYSSSSRGRDMLFSHWCW
jgi:hypothetical protein